MISDSRKISENGNNGFASKQDVNTAMLRTTNISPYRQVVDSELDARKIEILNSNLATHSLKNNIGPISLDSGPNSALVPQSMRNDQLSPGHLPSSLNNTKRQEGLESY